MDKALLPPSAFKFSPAQLKQIRGEVVRAIKFANNDNIVSLDLPDTSSELPTYLKTIPAAEFDTNLFNVFIRELELDVDSFMGSASRSDTRAKGKGRPANIAKRDLVQKIAKSYWEIMGLEPTKYRDGAFFGIVFIVLAAATPKVPLDIFPLVTKAIDSIFPT